MSCVVFVISLELQMPFNDFYRVFRGIRVSLFSQNHFTLSQEALIRGDKKKKIGGACEVDSQVSQSYHVSLSQHTNEHVTASTVSCPPNQQHTKCKSTDFGTD